MKNVLTIQSMLSKQLPIEGDNALLALAQLRFNEAGILAELHPQSPQHLIELLHFLPEGNGHTAHLTRDINPLEADGQERIIEIAKAGAGRIKGMILHDHSQMMIDLDDTYSKFKHLNDTLGALSYPVSLYVEFGCSLDIESYKHLINVLAPLEQISSCIDVGHVGLSACNNFFLEKTGYFPEELKSKVISQKQIVVLHKAMNCALPAVLQLIETIGRHDKSIHFHLHDGHPLSTLSPWGVSDHLSFLQKISYSIADETIIQESGIFGADGLNQILQAVMKNDMPAVSLSLEIHPQPGRTPLGRFDHIFSNWRDVRHAEMMNYWIEHIIDVVTLMRAANSVLP